jgi:phosphate starvation-inducible membrane PsiE
LGSLGARRESTEKSGMTQHYIDQKLVDLGNKLFEIFHLIGLFVIGAAILWASWMEVFHIIDQGGPKIKDVLLLFIYLEMGAMVGIYFQTKRLPVRYLIYIALTALTRVLAVDIKEMSDLHMITLSGSILLLAVAILVLRFGSTKFGSHDHESS